MTEERGTVGPRGTGHGNGYGTAHGTHTAMPFTVYGVVPAIKILGTVGGTTYHCGASCGRAGGRVIEARRHTPPRMFCVVGMKTPLNVPSCSTQNALGLTKRRLCNAIHAYGYLHRCRHAW